MKKPSTFAATLAVVGITASAQAGQYNQERWTSGANPPTVTFKQAEPYPTIFVKAGPDGYSGLDMAKTNGFWLHADIKSTCNGLQKHSRINVGISKYADFYDQTAPRTNLIITEAKDLQKGMAHYSSIVPVGGAKPHKHLVNEAVEYCNAELAKRVQQGDQTKAEILTKGFVLPYHQRTQAPDSYFRTLSACYIFNQSGYFRTFTGVPPKITYDCGAYIPGTPGAKPKPASTKPGDGNADPKNGKVTAIHLNRSGNMSLKGSCPFTMKFESTINVDKNGIPVKFGYKTHDNIQSETFTKTSANSMVKHTTQIIVGEKNTAPKVGNAKGKMYSGTLRVRTLEPSAKLAKKDWTFECLPEGQNFSQNQPGSKEPKPKPEPKQFGLQVSDVPHKKADIERATKITIGGKPVNQNGVIELTLADSLGLDGDKCAFVATWQTKNGGNADTGAFQTWITEGATKHAT
ncbi:MAG: hypothetical protein ACPG06_09185, partial [Alphaproteobacteria bacterium]